MKRRKFILIAILTGSSTLVSSCFKSSPAKRVEKFTRLMEKGNVNEAMTFFSVNFTKILGEDKTRLALSEGVKDIQRKGGIKSFTVNSETITGDLATVKYTVEYEDGSQEYNEVELVKENDEWKISPSK